MFKHLKCGLVALATVGVIAPQNVFATDSVQSPITTTPDVKLVNGELVGRVIAGEGQPVVTTVKVAQGEREVASVNTDATGAYKVAGLKTGQYVVSTEAGAANVRVWEAAAPPKAADSLIIAEGPVVRGQLLGTGLLGFGTTTSTLVTVGVVGAVVGTTVAIAEANDDDPPASP